MSKPAGGMRGRITPLIARRHRLVKLHGQKASGAHSLSDSAHLTSHHANAILARETILHSFPATHNIHRQQFQMCWSL